MPLEKGMRATVSKRFACVEPFVRPSSAGGEASMEDKGIAELFGGPGPTKISFVPWRCQRQLDEVLLSYLVTSGNEGRREGREMAVVTTAFGLVNCIAWLGGSKTLLSPIQFVIQRVGIMSGGIIVPGFPMSCNP